MFGTVTLAACLVVTAHFHVNESIDATRPHGRPPISKRKFEHSHTFGFGKILPWMSELSPLSQRTPSASHSRSKYAASLLDPSSFGNATAVRMPPVKFSDDWTL